LLSSAIVSSSIVLKEQYRCYKRNQLPNFTHTHTQLLAGYANL